ncbi:MAG: DAK2 domain-containing protein [Dehalococcoidia bacterium]|nr:DAK2 domain-containing protein [Dehalococcoidia bacterium]
MTPDAIARPFRTLSGWDLLEMVKAGSAWVAASASEINALNVFPVPDGDTGTNMTLTLRATTEQALACPQGASAGAVARAMAHGALMGARGNRGVILSQLFQGLAQALDGKEAATGSDIADALDQATRLAYKVVSNPVEGTILTVMKDVTAAALDAARQGGGVPDVLNVAATVARASVARTPDLLPILREAGVVDAGGQGLAVFLDGGMHFLRGERTPPPARELGVAAPRPSVEGATRPGTVTYGYCIEFMLEGKGLDTEHIRRQVREFGDSTIVAGAEGLVKVHLHGSDPDAVLAFARGLGVVVHTKVENIDQQHREFSGRRSASEAHPSVEGGQVGLVAVAPGRGLADVMRSLTAQVLTPDERSGKPSVQDLLRAIEMCHAETVVLLPNSGDILPAAEQAARMAPKQVKVVPTRTVPQGIAALVAFRAEVSLDANCAAMTRAAGRVRSAVVTTASRPAHIGGREVVAGQVIGLVDDELAAVEATPEAAARVTIERMGVEAGRLLTLYYGADATREDAEVLARWALARFPGCEAEVVMGGQPHYHYLISVE